MCNAFQINNAKIASRKNLIIEYQDNPFNVLNHIWQTPRDDTHKAIFGHSTGEIAALTHDTLEPTPPLSLDPDTLRLPFTQPMLREATHLEAAATAR